MAQKLYVVRAWSGITHDVITPWIAPLQKLCDEFVADWAAFNVQPVEIVYIDRLADMPTDGWPIYINRHSADPGALGWHTDDAGQTCPIYGRVFAGDCQQYGVSVSVDLAHEVLETIGDPDAQETWQMPDGRFAAREACDAVEADDYAITIDSVKLSDYVLPTYFSTGAGPWDKQRVLAGPCPDLTPGGYMSIGDVNGNWTQITADHHNGLMSRRAAMTGYRSLIRSLGGTKTPIPEQLIKAAPYIA